MLKSVLIHQWNKEAFMKDKKYIVYTQANKLGLKGEFDNAKDAIKWAKENVNNIDGFLLDYIHKG